MPTTLEKPISTSTEMPNDLEKRVHARIKSMSKKELRAWKKDSQKIIESARQRAGVQADTCESSPHHARVLPG
jgi:hypothetical protein